MQAFLHHQLDEVLLGGVVLLGVPRNKQKGVYLLSLCAPEFQKLDGISLSLSLAQTFGVCASDFA